MLESNTLRGRFRVELSMMLPAAATIDGNDRTREMKELSISYILTLEKDSRYLKVHTKLHNEHRDHKLTVNFPTGVANAEFAACDVGEVVQAFHKAAGLLIQHVESTVGMQRDLQVFVFQHAAVSGDKRTVFHDLGMAGKLRSPHTHGVSHVAVLRQPGLYQDVLAVGLELDVLSFP